MKRTSLVTVIMLCLIMSTILCACGSKSTDTWICEVCGKETSGNYCSNCGAERPDDTRAEWICSSCGSTSIGSYCSNCGNPKPEQETAEDNSSLVAESNDTVLPNEKVWQTNTSVPTPTSAISITHVPEVVNISPDKYTWYVQDYIGRNAASIGYTSISGIRYDRYGNGLLRINYVANDGTYVDIENDDMLKQFIVTGQSLNPNTEINLEYRIDSSGKEFSNLIDHQNYEEIDLLVSRLDGTMYNDAIGYVVAEINPSPDKYTEYIGNYVGKNLRSIGYTSIAGNRMMQIGGAYIKQNFVASDGTYIDPQDAEQLASYVVVSQDLSPNTQISMVYRTDSDGNEFSNLVDYQSYDQLTFYVEKINTPPVDDAQEDGEG